MSFAPPDDNRRASAAGSPPQPHGVRLPHMRRTGLERRSISLWELRRTIDHATPPCDWHLAC